jgi:hypothetical protein
LSCTDRLQKLASRFCHTLLHPKFINHRERLKLFCSLKDAAFRTRLADHYKIQVFDL